MAAIDARKAQKLHEFNNNSFLRKRIRSNGKIFLANKEIDMNKSTWPFPSPNQMGGKKKVHFKHVHYLSVGQGAIVEPVDHPDTENVSNKSPARTSTVQQINEDGSFETLNTIYIPVTH